jgi:glutamine---fructose-6-phosphate transaminase (isomerizing)
MSFMRQEAGEAPDAVQRFLDANAKQLVDLGAVLGRLEPPFILTSARGSSDHAASYFKYLAEILLGTPCASVGASVASIYGAQLKAKNALTLTISQSGKSPDILALQSTAKRAGALTVAVVNADRSPAAQQADICLPMCAGTEHSVAATKTFVVSLVAAASIVAHWLNDASLKSAIAHLPEQLAAATQLHWQPFVEFTSDLESLYVLGRGPSLPIASETALKLKETCAIHAESYSVAEVMHGPLELVDQDFSVFAYAQADQSLASTKAAVAKLKQSNARVLFAGDGGLPVVQADHPVLEPILMIQSAYLAVEAVAQRRGRNPDRPRMLHKVTETM